MEKIKIYRVFGGGRLNETVCFEQAISEWILKEKNAKALTAFIWLKIGKIGWADRLIDMTKLTVAFHRYKNPELKPTSSGY